MSTVRENLKMALASVESVLASAGSSKLLIEAAIREVDEAIEEIKGCDHSERVNTAGMGADAPQWMCRKCGFEGLGE